MASVVAAAERAVTSVDARALHRRRRLFALLVGSTMAAVLTSLILVLGRDGLSAVDLLMTLAFSVTLPWTVVGFWNAVIGLIILRTRRRPVHYVAPLAGLEDPDVVPRGRTAIVMPVYNEDPQLVVRHLEATVDDLAASGDLSTFEVFLLSDTQDPELIVEEEEAVRALRERAIFADRFHYRRRRENTAYKTGNLWDFLDSHGDRFDHMLVLDADSLMSGAAIRRLVRVMEANPRLGILQSLITGLPTRSAFTRMFQFGMRHGMRSHTTGGAWWQGPCGPYWGHNALINVQAFRAHCRLPTLPGSAPWGGLLLSHDMVEAVLMQRAGFEVRVLPDEFGSYELNPPCLPEFVRRSLRWCQGNLQYLRLVGRPGWHPMGRLQLGLAIFMYLGGAAWLVFMTLAFVQGTFGVQGAGISTNPWGAVPSWLGFALLGTMVTMAFAPKITGLIDALMDRRRRQSYGGTFPLLGAGFLELIHGMFLAPIMAVGETLFIGRLLTGRGLAWNAQLRRGRGVGWGEAVRRFWPHTLVGAGMLSAFYVWAPSLVLWIVPVALGPLLIIPFAWLTTRPGLGAWLARVRFAAVPEERQPPIEVVEAVPWVRGRGRQRTQAAIPRAVEGPVEDAAPI